MEQRLARKRAFAEFLDWEDTDGWSLKGEIESDVLGQQGSKKVVTGLTRRRFNVPITRINAWNHNLKTQMLEHPAEFLPGFQDAIKDYARSNQELAPYIQEDTEIFVGLKGDLGKEDLSPRELNSSHLGKLVKVYGIVTKCSLVRPKLVKSVHYAPQSDTYVTQTYRDVTALTGIPTGEI